jgi:hypothetical protein
MVNVILISFRYTKEETTNQMHLFCFEYWNSP